MKHRNTCHQKSFASFNMEDDFDLCIAGQSLKWSNLVDTKKWSEFPPEIDWYSHQWPQDCKMLYMRAVLVNINSLTDCSSRLPVVQGRSNSCIPSLCNANLKQCLAVTPNTKHYFCLEISLAVTVKLKGLSTLRWTCSGIKECDLLILALILIFQFDEPPTSGRDSRQKMSNPIGKSY